MLFLLLERIRLRERKNYAIVPVLAHIRGHGGREAIILPTHGVVGVVVFLGPAGELEGAEGIHHDGQFVGGFFADRGLGGAGVRAVGDTVRVEGKGSDIYAAPAHEVAVDIVDDFFAVYVGVIVGGWDGERVVVILARNEGANHEVVGLKGLVDGRRLVDATCYGLEIADVKDVGV
jgi:hypothetical protein